MRKLSVGNDLSRHAEIRLRQRGIPHRILNLVFEHADISLNAGDGCETIAISSHAAQDLILAGINSDDAARASKLAVVLGKNGVVTVLRPIAGSRGRSYRRQLPTRNAANGRR